MPKKDSPTSGRRSAERKGESGGNGQMPGRLGDLAPLEARSGHLEAKVGGSNKEKDEKKAGWFDAEAFYAALDAERQARSSTWKTVANSSGVSASTLTRIAQGARPDVDSLAALAAWANFDANAFVRRNGATPIADAQPLAMISTYLKTDPQLSPEAATALDQLIKVAYAQFRKTPTQ